MKKKGPLVPSHSMLKQNFEPNSKRRGMGPNSSLKKETRKRHRLVAGSTPETESYTDQSELLNWVCLIFND